MAMQSPWIITLPIVVMSKLTGAPPPATGPALYEATRARLRYVPTPLNLPKKEGETTYLAVSSFKYGLWGYNKCERVKGSFHGFSTTETDMMTEKPFESVVYIPTEDIEAVTVDLENKQVKSEKYNLDKSNYTTVEKVNEEFYKFTRLKLPERIPYEQSPVYIPVSDFSALSQLGGRRRHSQRRHSRRRHSRRRHSQRRRRTSRK